MEVVTGALPSVITKLGDLLVGEYNLQKGVKGEIRFLRSELESMKGALEKVCNTPSDQLDIQDKIWTRDLRELSYDIEDSIDRFMVRGNRDESAKLHGIKKFIDRSVGLFRKAKVRHGIATEVSDIKSRVIEIDERRRRYDVNLAVDKPAITTVDPRLFYQYTMAKELVGIDETRDQLIKILMEESGVPLQQGKIVSIVGFGGLGKTTLAKAVYEKIRELFDCCAFVSVSQTPDLKKLFKVLLSDLDKNINGEIFDERRLIDVIREFLKLKRYFIVIDDIWDISVWSMIKCALPDNDVGYVIITTTRKFDVAEKAGGAYKLEPLSENNSKKLLYRRVFGIENKDNIEDVEKCPNKELSEVCDRILKKCAGVPLAIITMASLLACKARNKMYWYEVYDSIGTGLENSLDLDNMRKILSLGYYNMPSHLRTCLLYLSVFPEDYEINKQRLIKMWIAEGFIQCEKQEESLFEVGESYFNELINRSMIQPLSFHWSEEVYGCRVHDMVLDLICFLSSEENFVTKDQISPPRTIRRLSLQNGKQDDTIPPRTTSFQQVRSFVVFPAAISLIPVLIKDFKLLRVLDLKDCDLSQGYSLKYLGNLLHLRYLQLQHTGIVQLPEEIGSLKFLQMLNVTGNKISCLPSSIFQLKHLMSLYIDYSTRVPNGIGSLTSLEELSHLPIDDSNLGILDEIGKLTELRELSIGIGRNCNLVECLGKLQKIRHLNIWDCNQRWNTYGLDAWVAPRHLRSLNTAFATLPAWMNPSRVPDLSSLDISVRELKQGDLDILGKLPALRFLRLVVEHKDLGIPRGFLVGAGTFPCLVDFRLRGSVGPAAFQHGAMPRLRELSLEFSVRVARETASTYGGLDLGLGNLASLQRVYFNFDYKDALDEEVKELKAALRHVIDIHPNHPRMS